MNETTDLKQQQKLVDRMRNAWQAEFVWRKKQPGIKLSIASYTTDPPRFQLSNGESITPEAFDSEFSWGKPKPA